MDRNDRVDISSRIFTQADRLSIVADQLWKTNHETGCVNSAVASWCEKEVVEVVTQLNTIAKRMAEEVMLSGMIFDKIDAEAVAKKTAERAEFPKFME